MNKQRFSDVIDMLKKIPSIHFDLDYFIRSKSNVTNDVVFQQLCEVAQRLTAGSCGATGCVIGFCPAFFPKDFSYCADYGWVKNNQTGRTGFAAMEDFLDISSYECEWLFEPSHYLESNEDGEWGGKVRKETVIARMEECLNGFPDLTEGFPIEDGEENEDYEG